MKKVFSKKRNYYIGIRLSEDRKTAIVYLVTDQRLMPHVDEIVGWVKTTKTNLEETSGKWMDHQKNRNPWLYRQVEKVLIRKF